MKLIHASFTHPKGNIKMNLNFEGKIVTGEITVPENIETDFVWNGKSIKLRAGVNKIK